MMNMIELWEIILTMLIGVISWVLREKNTQIQRLDIQLNKTREEIAKEYATKLEVYNNIDRVMNRLDILDMKLDKIINKN